MTMFLRKHRNTLAIGAGILAAAAATFGAVAVSRRKKKELFT